MLCRRRDADNRCNKVSGLSVLDTEHGRYLPPFIETVLDVFGAVFCAHEKKAVGNDGIVAPYFERGLRLDIVILWCVVFQRKFHSSWQLRPPIPLPVKKCES